MTPKSTTALDLDVDLEGGVVPISKAASSLAALLKRARDRRQPIIVTQKGYPTGALRALDRRHLLNMASPTATPEEPLTLVWYCYGTKQML